MESVISHPQNESVISHPQNESVISHTQNDCKVCYSHFWWTLPNKVVCYGHMCTSTCIVYHKLCEFIFYHVFQREYITKLITHVPVQFNYVKIMNYHYL